MPNTKIDWKTPLKIFIGTGIILSSYLMREYNLIIAHSKNSTLKHWQKGTELTIYNNNKTTKIFYDINNDTIPDILIKKTYLLEERIFRINKEYILIDQNEINQYKKERNRLQLK